MNSNGNADQTATFADQLSDEIGRMVKLTVEREIASKVKAAVVAYADKLPSPVVQFAPDIKLPEPPTPIVNFSLDHAALAASLAIAIKEAFSGLKIPAPTVTVNPVVNVTVERKPIDITFERNRDGQLSGAKLVPQKA